MVGEPSHRLRRQTSVSDQGALLVSRLHRIHETALYVHVRAFPRLDRLETGAIRKLIYGATVKILDLVSEVHVFRFHPRVETFGPITNRRHYDAIRRALR